MLRWDFKSHLHMIIARMTLEGSIVQGSADMMKYFEPTRDCHVQEDW